MFSSFIQDVLLAGALQFTVDVTCSWVVVLHLCNEHPSLSEKDKMQRTVQRMAVLVVTTMCCTGSIPFNWGLPGTFPALQAFEILAAQISGTIPPFWGTNGSLPALVFLHLDSCPLSGTLSADWGSPSAFPQLAGLSITNCSLSGLSQCRPCESLGRRLKQCKSNRVALHHNASYTVTSGCMTALSAA